MYVDGQSCYGFYQCIKGKFCYFICYDGFYFNLYKQGCFLDLICYWNNLVYCKFIFDGVRFVYCILRYSY